MNAVKKILNGNCSTGKYPGVIWKALDLSAVTQLLNHCVLQDAEVNEAPKS